MKHAEISVHLLRDNDDGSKTDSHTQQTVNKLTLSNTQYTTNPHFYPNVTTLCLGLCYHKSVCLSLVYNVRVPYLGGWTFRQYFFTAVYLSHILTSVQNFMEIVPGEPLHRLQLMTNKKWHDKFTGVTANDLDPSRTRISRLSEFSVVNSTEITINMPHNAHILWIGRQHKPTSIICNRYVLPRRTFRKWLCRSIHSSVVNK